VYRELHHAVILAENVLGPQKQAIDQFTPTDLDKLPELPIDQSGYLGARAMRGPANIGYNNAGVYQPEGELHFEIDPLTAERLFKTTGVEWVAQYRDEVFQTHNAAGAAHFVDRYAALLQASPDVRPTTPVAGLPAARCFERPVGWESITKESEIGHKTEAWHFACVARAERYAYVTYSDDETDIKQQVSAQYRILAGK
jgi:hypothetical protein